MKNSSHKILNKFKNGVNRLIGKKMGDQVLPLRRSSELKEQALIERNRFEKQRTAYPIETQQYFVPVASKANLDSYEIKSRNLADIYIINLMSNADTYEQNLVESAQLATDLNINIINFNYRGICGSEGFANEFADLVRDTKEEVKHLITKGVKAQNIILSGFSLGGGIAALAADSLLKEGIQVNIFCDRPFSSVTNEVVGLIREGKFFSEDFHETRRRKLLSEMLKPIVKLLTNASKWEGNVAKAYRNIPDEYKEYIVVRSRKDKRNWYRKDDTYIPYPASLHQAVKEYEPDKSRRQARKFETSSEEEEGHMAPLKEIHNRYGQSGSEFFKAFVDRVKARDENDKLKLSL